MTFFVQPRLVNGPFGDPGLFLDFRFAKRALLFDLGDLRNLSGRELMRVSDVFVSHTHLDHFAGFDELLRVCLHRAAPLRLVGPPGFADQVEHRLLAYTWNLLDEEAVDFVIEVGEFEDGAVARAARFRARQAFRREDAAAQPLPPGIVIEEDAFRIDAAVLDHGTASLAVAFRERIRVNVWREGLRRLDLPVGPWLNEAKAAVRQNAPDDTVIGIDGRAIELGALREHVLRTAPGQSLAYVVDAAFTQANAARILMLAKGVDQLFIEAVFLDEDAVLASAKRHLTAGQAGRLAREAGASQVIPLHHSRRYQSRPEALIDEVRQAFAGCRP